MPSKASEWRDKIRAYNAGPKSNTPVDEQIPDSWEPAEDVTESDITRQLNDRGDPAPNILTPFAKRVIPIYAQPSDLLNVYTYTLTGGEVATQVYNDQVAGMGCQVTLINYGDGDGAGNILISSDQSFISPTTAGGHQASCIMLEAPGSGVQSLPFVLTTRQGLWAACVDDVTAYLGVIVETYEPDSHTWEPWQPGRQ